MTEEMMSVSEAGRQVTLALRRLAIYHATMVAVLKETLGDEKGQALSEAVADRYGETIGHMARARTDALGLSPDEANYAEDLPSLGFDAERVADAPWTVRVHHCPLAATWREMGCPQDGEIYCRVDSAKYDAYNPGLACRHTVHTLRDGTSYCELVVSPKTIGSDR